MIRCGYLVSDKISYRGNEGRGGCSFLMVYGIGFCCFIFDVMMIF